MKGTKRGYCTGVKSGWNAGARNQKSFSGTCGEGGGPKTAKCFGCLKHCNPAEIPYCITEALIHAVKGDTENGLLFCGAQGFLANQIETVQDVMEDLLGGL